MIAYLAALPLALLTTECTCPYANASCASAKTYAMPAAVWSIKAYDHEHSMTLTASVKLDGTIASSGTLVAFSADGQVRGMGSPKVVPFGPHAGESLFMLMIYGSRETEAITFRHTLEEVAKGDVMQLEPTRSTKLVSVEAASFKADDTLGDALQPLVLTGAMLEAAEEQTTPWPRASATAGASAALSAQESCVQGRQ